MIVESPAKAKTINKYLGDDYIVKASMGHVRDLPSKGMGVDLKTFEPRIRNHRRAGKDKVVSELKKLAKDADRHLSGDRLGPRGRGHRLAPQGSAGHPRRRKASRVIFNAITKTEIQKAFKQPACDRHRPRQRAAGPPNPRPHRRLRDLARCCGGRSPRGSCAGRVQSVAVRLVVEREREIEAFVPQEYWKIGGDLHHRRSADACADARRAVASTS